MSYLSECGYKNDVFVSYAHADDQELLGMKGWVSNFVDDLGKFLVKKLGRVDGRSPHIWIDPELARNRPLDDALANELKETAVYLIIMSPAYIASEWCKKERQQFFEILKNKKSSTRVFIVEIDEIDRKSYPGEINEFLVPYKFWKKDISSKPVTLGFPRRDTEEYGNKLVDIATDMASELIQIRDSANSLLSFPKECVFLAQVTDDLDDRREEVKRYLKDAGYRILPEEDWLLTEPDKLKACLEEKLSQCVLYVQLLSDLPGKKLPGNAALTKFQFEVARAAAKKMMVWRSPELSLENVKDEDLKKLIESEYVRSEGIEEFKVALVSALTQKENAPLMKSFESDEENLRFVYVCTDPIDLSYSQQVIIKEIQKRAMGWSLPLKSKDPAKVRIYQEQNFLNCDAAVFVYCESDPSMVFNQLMHCHKTISKRDKPFELIAIYDGPPKNEDEDGIDIELPKLKVSYLNCRKNTNDFTEKFLNILCKHA